jgi:glycine betaine catabolism A
MTATADDATKQALPASLLATMPGRYYSDPAVFETEQARIFEAMWFCAVRSADLPSAGHYRTVQVGRESIVVVRDAAGPQGGPGELRAFFNVCRHRGSRLCEEPAGQVRRSIQCSYHAWTYGLDGRLIAAPNLTGMPDVDRVGFGLVQVALREWLGYAWVCLADEPPSFEEQVVAACTERLGNAEMIESYGIASLDLGRRISYDVAANWKLIIENFMECYHCATIHPELTEVLPEFADGLAAQYYVGHGAEFGPEIAGFTVDGSPGFDRIPGIAEDQDRRYYAITVRPQVFLNLVPDHVIIHRMFPLAVDRTIVECDWLFAPELLATQPDLSRSVELFDRVNRQDFDACERCQLGTTSRLYANGGVFVPAEHHIAGLGEWVDGMLGDAVH